MILVGNDQLCVGDWPSKELIVYSLTGEVLRKVPCPPPLIMAGDVSMCNCAANNVVISDKGSAIVAKMSLEDGRLLWSFTSIERPDGI